MLLNYVTSIYQIKLYNLKNIALCFEIYLCGYALDSHAGDKITSQRCFLTLATPTFGHTNANFFCFIYRIGNQFLKKWIMITIWICIAWPNCLAGFATDQWTDFFIGRVLFTISSIEFSLNKEARKLSWRCYHVPIWSELEKIHYICLYKLSTRTLLQNCLPI